MSERSMARDCDGWRSHRRQSVETLIEFIFTRGGWQRTSELGKGQADVDLIIVQPITREKACVQIKSTADQRQLNNYLDRFLNDGSCERFFFVCHKGRGRLSLSHKQMSSQHKADIWSGERIAQAAVDAGLFGWLKERV